MASLCVALALAALYRRLEEQTTGKSWLSDVPPAYKVVLSVEMDGALRQAVPQLTDGEGLLANLRQLLEGRYPPAGNLREMLEAVDVEDAAAELEAQCPAAPNTFPSLHPFCSSALNPSPQNLLCVQSLMKK